MTPASLRPARVLAEVEAVMRGPIIWGRSDCCAAVRAVVLRLGLPDPMPDYAGRYRSPIEAWRLCPGGMAAHARRSLRAAGYRRAAPCPGAIGLLSVPGPLPMAAAICIEPGHWAKRTPGGFEIINLPRGWAWSES